MYKTLAVLLFLPLLVSRLFFDSLVAVGHATKKAVVDEFHGLIRLFRG